MRPPDPFVAADLDDIGAALDVSASELKRAVERLSQAGVPQVSVIGHSQGADCPGAARTRTRQRAGFDAMLTRIHRQTVSR